MNVIPLKPGVKIYKKGEKSALFGCPPEIIKSIINKKLPFPDTIILPDVLFQFGTLQNCTEFPLYYYLFVLGNYFKGKKLTIVGEALHLDHNKELLRLTLLGPTQEEFASLGESPYYKTLYQEARYLSVKDSNGKEVPIEGFINFIPFQNGRVDTEDFTILHKDTNVYEIDKHVVNIQFDAEQLPPYPVNEDYVPMTPHRFGVDVLGGGSGFTPLKPSSAVLLNYNSDYMLIDCLAYLDYNLRARGISRQQVKSIFLSHIHDDHCNIFPLVEFNTKLKFLGTKEIYWMALKKLSLQTMHKMDEFYSYFDFVELEPYQENDFYGISIIPHYTVHSIPTIGATFLMNNQDRVFSIAFGGDNKSIKEIKKMVDLGIVPSEKYQYLQELYRRRFGVLLADGGMGILHGDPEDSLKSESDRVVFMHLEKLPEKFDATFSMAMTGKRYVLCESKTDSYLIKTMEIFHKHFPNISEEWVTALMNNINIITCNAGDVIFKQGDPRKGSIYIILSGRCAVMFHNGVKLSEIAEKETGDFIGEMAIIKNEERRSASIVAKTPVTLCEMDENIFLLFLKSENRIESIMQMWEIRKELEQIYPFTNFADLVNEKIAKVAHKRKVAKGETIIKQGEERKDFYIILEGTFSVYRDQERIGSLRQGEFFGEIAALKNTMRNASVIAETSSFVLEIAGIHIEKIINETPILNFIINQIMKERKQGD